MPWPVAMQAETGLACGQDAAAFARALQLPEAPAWLFAAPVLLRPEHAGIYLLGSRPLALTELEAADFCAELNRWLEQDEMQLYPVSATRWLLALPKASAVQWTPLFDAIGMDLRQIAPRGDDALRWQSRLTEWQMLLNQSPHNQRRQQQGLPPVHSLWLWGQQAATTAAAASTAAVFTADPQSLPLAADSAAKVVSLPDWLTTAPATAVVYDDRLADPFAHGDSAGYQQIYSQLLLETVAPLQRLLADGAIAEFALYPDDGFVYRARVSQRWQFWRRPTLPEALRSV